MRIKFFIFSLIFIFTGFIYCEEECRWVESKGYAVVDNITPNEARELAKRRARAEAIAKAVGTEVSSFTVIKDFEVEAELIKSFSKGVIIKEDIKRENWEVKEDKDNPGSSILTLNYRACVKKIEDEPDPYFNVKLEMEANTFVEGDETYFKVYCTRDCYITIFNITSENKVSILYPNKYFKENFLKQDSYFEFPPKKSRDLGLKLRVRTLPNQKENTELVWVVATKEKIDFYNLLCKKKKGRGFCEEKDFSPDLKDLLLVLSGIPLNQRSEDVEVM